MNSKMGRVYSSKLASKGSHMYFKTETPLLSTQKWAEFFRVGQPPYIIKCI